MFLFQTQELQLGTGHSLFPLIINSKNRGNTIVHPSGRRKMDEGFENASNWTLLLCLWIFIYSFFQTGRFFCLILVQFWYNLLDLHTCFTGIALTNLGCYNHHLRVHFSWRACKNMPLSHSVGQIHSFVLRQSCKCLLVNAESIHFLLLMSLRMGQRIQQIFPGRSEIRFSSILFQYPAASFLLQTHLLPTWTFILKDNKIMKRFLQCDFFFFIYQRKGSSLAFFRVSHLALTPIISSVRPPPPCHKMDEAGDRRSIREESKPHKNLFELSRLGRGTLSSAGLPHVPLKKVRWPRHWGGRSQTVLLLLKLRQLLPSKVDF